MQVEVWSDIMCPFCYIGKRKFESALAQFPDKDRTQLVWKSFQLAPDMKTDPTKNIHQYLSVYKGISIEDAKRMNNHVTQLAKQVELVYNFDKSIVANSGAQDSATFLELLKKSFTEWKMENARVLL
jgi:predicted DsbA family dithiol-disulfide isomerase